MKKIMNFMLGIWCALSCFITPIWLTLIYVNLTGLIYQYDYSMDKGTAGIFGVAFLVLWILFALIPNIIFVKRINKIDKKYVLFYTLVIVVLVVFCMKICGWNIIRFLFLN